MDVGASVGALNFIKLYKSLMKISKFLENFLKYSPESILERISMGWLGQCGYSRKFPIKLWLTFYLGGFVLYICDFDIKISIFQNHKFGDIWADMLTLARGEWRKIIFVDEFKSVQRRFESFSGLQWCWWQWSVGDFEMVTVLRCWWQNNNIGYFFSDVGAFLIDNELS